MATTARSPRSARPDRGRGDRRGPGRPPLMDRQRIVSVALEIAHEHGVKAVTMTSVAERLGVAMPALYYHVSSRDELLGLIGISLLHTETPAEHRARRLARLDDRVRTGAAPASAARADAQRRPGRPRLQHEQHADARAGGDGAHPRRLHRIRCAVELRLPGPTVLSSVYREHCLAVERAQGRTQLSTTRAAIKAGRARCGTDHVAGHANLGRQARQLRERPRPPLRTRDSSCCSTASKCSSRPRASRQQAD